MQNFRAIDESLYDEIEAQATWTGNRTNGIKDGIRDEWYAKFDLGTPARSRNMPYTCVVDRPDLQEILLRAISEQHAQRRGDLVVRVRGIGRRDGGAGERREGDGRRPHRRRRHLVQRARRHDRDARGRGSGVSYSGYTVFAGELDVQQRRRRDIGPECGYKVYIGPNQYFVITDIGRGRYQWYAFLARPPARRRRRRSRTARRRTCRTSSTGWSPEVIDILQATQEHEIEQRDLYDRPPSVLKPWNDGSVALLSATPCTR